MSTVKVDNITSSLLPLPVVDGVNEKQSHVSVAGQTQFAVTKFQRGSNLRVFVGKVEATWEWLAATTTIKINTPAIPAGSNIHIYRQTIGDAPQDGKMYVRLNGAWVELPRN